jgi:hypothetical protein
MASDFHGVLPCLVTPVDENGGEPIPPQAPLGDEARREIAGALERAGALGPA